MKTYTLTKTKAGFLLSSVDTVHLGWFADETDARYAQGYMNRTGGTDLMERVRRREAAMREALSKVAIAGFVGDMTKEKFQASISDNAGFDFVPRAEVQPLIEALEFAALDLCGSQSEAQMALDHARGKGWCE